MIRAFPSLHDGGYHTAESIKIGLGIGVGLALLTMSRGHWGGNDVYCTVAAGLATTCAMRFGLWARDANHWVDAVVLGGIGGLSAMGALGLGISVLVSP